MTRRLKVSNLSYSYGKRPVLNRLDLSVDSGEVVGIIGPNGAGKTTLLRCFVGILHPQYGKITIEGIALKENPFEAKSRIGYGIVPGELPDLLTGRQVLQIVATARGLQSIPSDCIDLADRLESTRDLDLRLGACSAGQRQKVGVLAAFIGNPPLILLDEPFNALDPSAAFELKQVIVEKVRVEDLSVLVSTHAIANAEAFLDRALLLLNGSIFETWTPSDLQELRKDPERSLESEMAEVLRNYTATTS